MSAERPAFQRYQAEFTAHIRDPKGQPRPAGAPARRMRVYNELLFNNIGSALAACFPITREILGRRVWACLAREFFARHKCQSPLYRQVPEEFVRFLGDREPVASEPPFLAHFAHYEWVELAVDTSSAEPEWDRVDTGADVMQAAAVVNSTLRLLEYPYQVHRIGPDYKPAAPDPTPTRLLVFRDREDVVRFIVINDVTARLLSLFANAPESTPLAGKEACLRIASELAHPNPAAVIASGRAILQDLVLQGALLCFAQSPVIPGDDPPVN